MKRLFLPLAMLFFGACASAQVPSFKSFNPTQFSTNNFIISITNGALVTNVNNIETLFINGTNIFNLFAPASAGIQNYWTNISNVLQPVAGTSVIVTNLSSYTTLAAAGAFILDSTLNATLDIGTNCVTTFNQGGLGLTGQTTDPNDTTFNIDIGNAQGQILIIQNQNDNSAFTMLNGSPFCDGVPSFTRLNGNWITTNRGDGLLLYNTGNIWTEIGRFQGGTNIISGDNVWENVSGNIRPVNGNANNVLSFTSGLADNATNVAMVVNTTNLWSASGSLLAAYQNAGTNNLTISPWGGIQIGRTTAAFWGPLSAQESLISLHDSSAGESDANELFIGATPNGSTVTMWDLAVDVSPVPFAQFVGRVGGTDRVLFDPTVASSGSAVAYLFDTSNVLTNGDKFVSIKNSGTEVLNISPNDTGAQIVWGPGTTNVLRRAGSDLEWTNATTSSMYFTLRKETTSKIAKFGMTSGGNPIVEGAAGSGVLIAPNAASTQYFFVDGGMYPVNAGKTLGTTTANNQWNRLLLESGGGAISWNGTTNSVFDTAGSGTPEGAVTASPGSLYRNYAGGAGSTIYYKETGAGNTGWVGVSAGMTINPTDNRIPYRQNSTTFGDSPWYVISTNSLGFNYTNRFFTFIGSGSLPNTFIGYESGNTTVSGSFNLGVGKNTLNSLTSGVNNVAVGDLSSDSLTDGTSNVSLGMFTLRDLTSGSGNTAVGHSALNDASGSSSQATAVGSNAGTHATNSSDSVMVGYRSGYQQTNILNSVIIGSLSQTNSPGSWTNIIAIGHMVNVPANNTAQIGTNGMTVLYLNGTVGWFRGTGTPESAVTAPVGSFYSREDGGANTSFYVKESGTGNTGWVAK